VLLSYGNELWGTQDITKAPDSARACRLLYEQDRIADEYFEKMLKIRDVRAQQIGDRDAIEKCGIWRVEGTALFSIGCADVIGPIPKRGL
jgi:hypothetical protein